MAKKNTNNIKNIEQCLSLGEIKRIEGIFRGILRFNRINASDMLLVLKMMYQLLNSNDIKKYKTGLEWEAIGYVRKSLHNMEDLKF